MAKTVATATAIAPLAVAPMHALTDAQKVATVVLAAKAVEKAATTAAVAVVVAVVVAVNAKARAKVVHSANALAPMASPWPQRPSACKAMELPTRTVRSNAQSAARAPNALSAMIAQSVANAATDPVAVVNATRTGSATNPHALSSKSTPKHQP